MPARQTEVVHQDGITIAELLVVVALVGLIAGIVITRGAAVSGGLKAGTDQLVATTKIARAYAMTTTTPHRLVPIDDRTLAIEYGGPCDDGSATWTPLEGEQYDLPQGVRFSSTVWDVCFNTRGWTTDVHDIRLVEGGSHQDLSVLLGGSTRVDPVYRQP